MIRIEFKDETIKEWRHENRAGGSWTKTLTLENGWATVTNEYGDTETFPREDIRCIETKE